MTEKLLFLCVLFGSSLFGCFCSLALGNGSSNVSHLHEAKMLGGLGACGRPLCCGTFLSDFQPVSIRMAKDQNLLTVQRFFALDSQGMGSIQEMLRSTNPHLMEIMPGVVGKAIRQFSAGTIPVIAGGLIETKQEVTAALGNGATAISTGRQELWDL